MISRIHGTEIHEDVLITVVIDVSEADTVTLLEMAEASTGGHVLEVLPVVVTVPVSPKHHHKT